MRLGRRRRFRNVIYSCRVGHLAGDDRITLLPLSPPAPFNTALVEAQPETSLVKLQAGPLACSTTPSPEPPDC